MYSANKRSGCWFSVTVLVVIIGACFSCSKSIEPSDEEPQSERPDCSTYDRGDGSIEHFACLVAQAVADERFEQSLSPEDQAAVALALHTLANARDRKDAGDISEEEYLSIIDTQDAACNEKIGTGCVDWLLAPLSQDVDCSGEPLSNCCGERGRVQNADYQYSQPNDSDGISVEGTSWASCTVLDGIDNNLNGLDDECEGALAWAFQPALMLSPADTGKARTPHFAVRQIGHRRIRVFYALSYHDDTGRESSGKGAHKGDVEFIILDLGNSHHDTWVLDGAFLSAHWNAYASDNSHWYGHDRFEYAGNNRGRPQIWVVPGKHGNYPDLKTCNDAWFYDECDKNSLASSVFGGASMPANRNIGLRNKSQQMQNKVSLNGNNEWFWEELWFCGWQVPDGNDREDAGCTDPHYTYGRSLVCAGMDWGPKGGQGFCDSCSKDEDCGRGGLCVKDPGGALACHQVCDDFPCPMGAVCVEVNGAARCQPTQNRSCSAYQTQPVPVADPCQGRPDGRYCGYELEGFNGSKDFVIHCQGSQTFHIEFCNSACSSKDNADAVCIQYIFPLESTECYQVESFLCEILYQQDFENPELFTDGAGSQLFSDGRMSLIHGFGAISSRITHGPGYRTKENSLSLHEHDEIAFGAAFAIEISAPANQAIFVSAYASSPNSKIHEILAHYGDCGWRTPQHGTIQGPEWKHYMAFTIPNSPLCDFPYVDDLRLQLETITSNGTGPSVLLDDIQVKACPVSAVDSSFCTPRTTFVSTESGTTPAAGVVSSRE